MSRSTDTDFPGAFRVVTAIKHKETGSPVGKTQYTGPYQTKGAAKGMLTRMLWEYNREGKKTEMSGEIQSTTGSWEKVESK